MQRLRERLAELSDLSGVQMLLEWDQMVMMPSAGGASRAQQLGTLARLTHERATAQELGDWLEELEGAQLEGLEGDIVRLARRDWERARRGPGYLAAGPRGGRLRRFCARLEAQRGAGASPWGVRSRAGAERV
jgi:carboxypeptidase Taq